MANFDWNSDTPKKGGFYADEHRNAITDTIHDIGIGAMKVPSAIAGIADIPLGLAGFNRPVSKALDKVGEYTGMPLSKMADEAQQRVYSPERKQANQAIEQAWQDYDAGNKNFAELAGAYISNPRALAGNIAQSLPSMVTGGLGGRALLGTKSLLAPAVGEAGVSAGQTMAGIDENVDPRKAAALSALSGAAVGGLGLAGGKMAQRFGWADPESVIGGVASTASQLSKPKQIIGGAASEGLLEELPQSLVEQGAQNLAEDKPITQGMARAGIEGALSGGLMGAGFNAMPRATPEVPSADQGQTPGYEYKGEGIAGPNMPMETPEAFDVSRRGPGDIDAEYTVTPTGQSVPDSVKESATQGGTLSTALLAGSQQVKTPARGLPGFNQPSDIQEAPEQPQESSFTPNIWFDGANEIEDNYAEPINATNNPRINAAIDTGTTGDNPATSREDRGTGSPVIAGDTGATVGGIGGISAGLQGQVPSDSQPGRALDDIGFRYLTATPEELAKIIRNGDASIHDIESVIHEYQPQFKNAQNANGDPLTLMPEAVQGFTYTAKQKALRNLTQAREMLINEADVEEAQKEEERKQTQKIKRQAELDAIKQKRESEKQKADTKEGAYYVTANLDGKTVVAAGPFINDHQSALDAVEKARQATIEAGDPRAHFAAWGTSRFDISEDLPEGKLNPILGINRNAKESTTGFTPEETAEIVKGRNLNQEIEQLGTKQNQELSNIQFDKLGINGINDYVKDEYKPANKGNARELWKDAERLYPDNKPAQEAYHVLMQGGSVKDLNELRQWAKDNAYTPEAADAVDSVASEVFYVPEAKPETKEPEIIKAKNGLKVGIYKSNTSPSTPAYKVDEAGDIFRSDGMGSWKKLSSNAKNPSHNINDVKWQLQNRADDYSFTNEQPNVQSQNPTAKETATEEAVNANINNGVSPNKQAKQSASDVLYPNVAANQEARNKPLVSDEQNAMPATGAQDQEQGISPAISGKDEGKATEAVSHKAQDSQLNLGDNVEEGGLVGVITDISTSNKFGNRATVKWNNGSVSVRPVNEFTKQAQEQPSIQPARPETPTVPQASLSTDTNAPAMVDSANEANQAVQDDKGVSPKQDITQPKSQRDKAEQVGDEQAEKNIHGVDRQPRLAESADELYAKVKQLSKEGVVNDQGRIVYPVINDVAGLKRYQFNREGQLERLNKTGSTAIPASKSEIEDINDAFDKDQLQIELPTPWGQSFGDKAGQATRILHSPRGMSFERQESKADTQATAGSTQDSIDSADTSNSDRDRLLGIFKSLGKDKQAKASDIDHPQAELIADVQNNWHRVLIEHGYIENKDKTYSDVNMDKIDNPKRILIKGKGCA